MLKKIGQNILHNVATKHVTHNVSHLYLQYIKRKIIVDFVVIAVLTTLLIFRVVFFLATQDVGIEHDSGWLLGAAKNMSISGKYASYSNLSADQTTGVVMNMWGEPNLQDVDGLVYFPQAISVGIGYVVPQAIILKLLGFGFWQYRLWPLIGFGLLIFLLFKLTYRIGGLLGVFATSAIYIARPEIFTNQSFEAFGEGWSLVYYILSLTMLHGQLSKKIFNPNIIVCSGIVFALSLQTKAISILLFPGILFTIFIYSLSKSGIGDKLVSFLRTFTSFSLGMTLPILIFEYFKLLQIKSVFGIQSYLVTFIESYFGYQKHAVGLDWNGVVSKFSIWEFVYSGQTILPWIVVLLLPIIFFRYYKNDRVYLCSLWISAICMLSWFVLLSPNGWLRHALPAVILIVTMVTAQLGRFAKWIVLSRYESVIVVFILFITTVSVMSTDFKNLQIMKSVHNAKWADWAILRKYPIQGLYSHPIFTWSNQSEVKKAIEKIPTSHKIYYISSFYVAEMSTLSGRVFYPLSRILSPGSDDTNNTIYIIIGPYQIGDLSRVDFQSFTEIMDKVCIETYIKNTSYHLCRSSINHVKSKLQ